MCRRILLVRLLTRLHIEIALLSRSNWISFTRGNLNSKNNIFFYQVSNNLTSELFIPRSIEWARVLVPWSRFLVFLYMRKKLMAIMVTIFYILLCNKISANFSFCKSLDRFLGQKLFFISYVLFREFLQRLCFLRKAVSSEKKNFSFSP